MTHILVVGQKSIGLVHHPDPVVTAMVRDLPGVSWDEEQRISYLPNSKQNIDLIFKRFKGVIWVNGEYFFKDHRLRSTNPELSIQHYRDRTFPAGTRTCPEAFFDKLEIKRYAMQTAKSYITRFEHFINSYPHVAIADMDERLIRDYLHALVKQGVSDSTLNLSINAIKFTTRRC